MTPPWALRRSARPSSFGADVTVLLSGNVLGQGLTVAVAPILTRLYSPGELGALAVFTSIVAVLSVGICLRYEVAIPLPDEDAEAGAIAWLCVGLSAAISAIVAAVAIALGSVIDDGGAFAELAPNLYLIAPSVFALGVIQTLTYWSLRRRRFAAIAGASMGQSGAQAGVQIGLGAAHWGAAGLLFGHAIGRLAGAFVLVWKLRLDSSLRSRPGTGALRKAARDYRRFPAVTLPSSALNSASAELPVLLIASLFGSVIVGFFGFTVRVLQAPMALVGQAVAQVFYAHTSALTDRGALQNTTGRVLTRLATLATVPLLLILIAGPELFGTVFGAEWRQAGVYARSLTPWLFLVFVAGPMSTLVFVLNRQTQELVFQAVLIAGRTGALLFGAAVGGAGTAINLFAVTSAVLWAGYLVWLVRLVGLSVARCAWLIGREIAWAAPLCLPVVVAFALRVDGLGLAAVIAATSVALVINAGLRARRPV